MNATAFVFMHTSGLLLWFLRGSIKHVLDTLHYDTFPWWNAQRSNWVIALPHSTNKRLRLIVITVWTKYLQTVWLSQNVIYTYSDQLWLGIDKSRHVRSSSGRFWTFNLRHAWVAMSPYLIYAWMHMLTVRMSAACQMHYANYDTAHLIRI